MTGVPSSGHAPKAIWLYIEHAAVSTPGVRIYCSYGGVIPASDCALKDSSQDKGIDIQRLGQACDADRTQT